jgi:hypothetical protein
MAFFAPHLNTDFDMKFLDDKTNNYVRQIVWNAVQYRREKYCLRIHLMK